LQLIRLNFDLKAHSILEWAFIFNNTVDFVVFLLVFENMAKSIAYISKVNKMYSSNEN